MPIGPLTARTCLVLAPDSAWTPVFCGGPLGAPPPEAQTSVFLGVWTDCSFRKERRWRARGGRRSSELSTAYPGGLPSLSRVLQRGLLPQQHDSIVRADEAKDSDFTYSNSPEYLKDVLCIVRVLESEFKRGPHGASYSIFFPFPPTPVVCLSD